MVDEGDGRVEPEASTERLGMSRLDSLATGVEDGAAAPAAVARAKTAKAAQAELDCMLWKRWLWDR